METKKKTDLKKGDLVYVLSGKDKTRKGKILEVIPQDGKVVIEGINVVKKHTKPTKTNPQGGVLDKALGVPYSKVMLVCTSCGLPTRVGKQKAQDGKMLRVCKHCSKQLD